MHARSSAAVDTPVRAALTSGADVVRNDAAPLLVERRSQLPSVASVALVLPAAILLYFVAAYAVNVPHWDDFNVLFLLDRFIHGRVTFADLWAQHNENRIFFPNLAYLAFTKICGDDLRAVMLFDVPLLAGSGYLFYRVWRRRVPHTTSWELVPASLLFFSLISFEDALSAFQLTWYFVMAGLAVTIYALDLGRERAWAFSAAVAAAVFASYSSLHGLFCWPIGALFLLGRAERVRLGVWIACAVATTIVYFHGLDTHQTGDIAIDSPLLRPFACISYAITAVGGLFTGNVLGSSAIVSLAGILGFALVACAGFACYAAFRARVPFLDVRLPIALLAFGALFLLAIGAGRSGGDLETAVASRYMMIVAFVPIATYLLLLAVLRRAPGDALARYGMAAYGSFVAVAIVCGFVIGNEAGAYEHTSRAASVAVFAGASLQDDASLQRLWCCADLVRSAATVAREDGLMTFAGAGTR